MAISQALAMSWESKGVEKLKARWATLMVLGVFLTILGFFSISMALVSTVISVVLLGSIFLAGGITEVIHGFTSKEWGGLFLHVICGLLYITAGSVLVLNPMVGAASVTIALGLFFVASGMVRALTSISYRFPSWGWSLLSGLVSFALGIWVLLNWPVAKYSIIGIFIGVDLVFAGVATMSLASAARRLPKIGEKIANNLQNRNTTTVQY